jgi:hypothetical protein
MRQERALVQDVGKNNIVVVLVKNRIGKYISRCVHS